MTKDVISLSISVLLLFKHYISHKITFGAPSSGGVLCSVAMLLLEIITHEHSIYTMDRPYFIACSFMQNSIDTEMVS